MKDASEANFKMPDMDYVKKVKACFVFFLGHALLLAFFSFLWIWGYTMHSTARDRIDDLNPWIWLAGAFAFTFFQF